MKFNNDDIIALTGTIIFHLVILLILYFTVIRSIVPDEEEGILVNFGNVNLAAGVFEPRGRSLPGEDAASVPNEAPAVPKQTQPEEIISQDMEESISLTDKKKEEEQKKKAEAERKEKERIEAERKKQEEQRQRQQAINDRVAGAFGIGDADSENQGDSETGTGNQGNPFGNSDMGANEGVGGIGASFDLKDRILRGGGLLKPRYDSNEEGRIVIDITVDPNGNVVNAQVGKRTNINNTAMRNSAINAAKQTKFNSIKGANNQMGTITYQYQFSR
ncbi:MAG: TonB family protein [Tannerella sp.]|jgi:TonB family protein|nr:TonB family protein [Tannerella sp.]